VPEFVELNAVKVYRITGNNRAVCLEGEQRICRGTFEDAYYPGTYPGLLSLVCWDSGFESRRGHRCLSLVNVVCCQVEVSATSWSLVHRSPTECGVSECDREASIMRRPWPTRGCCAIKKTIE
jgi:hypothetical protein